MDSDGSAELASATPFSSSAENKETSIQTDLRRMLSGIERPHEASAASNQRPPRLAPQPPTPRAHRPGTFIFANFHSTDDKSSLDYTPAKAAAAFRASSAS